MMTDLDLRVYHWQLQGKNRGPDQIQDKRRGYVVEMREAKEARGQEHDESAEDDSGIPEMNS
jgi:hypothetical protein